MLPYFAASHCEHQASNITDVKIINWQIKTQNMFLNFNQKH